MAKGRKETSPRSITWLLRAFRRVPTRDQKFMCSCADRGTPPLRAWWYGAVTTEMGSGNQPANHQPSAESSFSFVSVRVRTRICGRLMGARPASTSTNRSAGPWVGHDVTPPFFSHRRVTIAAHAHVVIHLHTGECKQVQRPPVQGVTVTVSKGFMYPCGIGVASMRGFQITKKAQLVVIG